MLLKFGHLNRLNSIGPVIDHKESNVHVASDNHRIRGAKTWQIFRPPTVLLPRLRIIIGSFNTHDKPG